MQWDCTVQIVPRDFSLFFSLVLLSIIRTDVNGRTRKKNSQTFPSNESIYSCDFEMT